MDIGQWMSCHGAYMYFSWKREKTRSMKFMLYTRRGAAAAARNPRGPSRRAQDRRQDRDVLSSTLGGRVACACERINRPAL